MRLVIFHFQPIENYPPIQNFLEFASSTGAYSQILCLTTYGELPLLDFKDPIRIVRLGKVYTNKFQLIYSYILYNSFSFFLLMVRNYKNALYFESISSFAPIIIKKYFKKKLRVFVHYHEYTTKKEYDLGGKFNKFFYKLETLAYHKLTWVSHTNEVRLNKFLVDNNIEFKSSIHKVLPNYPPKSWFRGTKQTRENTTMKFVYVGYSVDEISSYMREFIEYISKQKFNSSIDLYCVKENSLEVSYLGRKGNCTITAHKALKYNELPVELCEYDIGLILYRGSSENAIHIAPNKFFEYLASGLNVLFTKEVIGLHEYENESNPSVMKIDMTEINDLVLSPDLRHNNDFKSPYFAEEELEILNNQIIG